MNPIAALFGIAAAVFIWSAAALFIARHWLARGPRYLAVPDDDNDGEYLS